MKPLEQQKAIAEAMGWTDIEPCSCTNPDGSIPLKGRDPRSDPWPITHHLHGYLHDLNAMHEVEKVGQGLVRGFWTAYSAGLKIAGAIQITHATAAQRAEAFLRTIGKWKD